MLTHTNAAAVHTHILAGRMVCCDNTWCCEVGWCEHSKPHQWREDCSTCSHDLRATCMVKEETK